MNNGTSPRGDAIVGHSTTPLRRAPHSLDSLVSPRSSLRPIFLDSAELPGDRQDRCLVARRSLSSERMSRRFPIAAALLGGALLLGGCLTSSSPPPTTTTSFPKSGLAIQAPTRILYQGCGSTRQLTSATMRTTFFHPNLSNYYRSGTWRVGPGGSSGTIQTKSMGQASTVSTPLAIYLNASARFWKQLSTTLGTHATALANKWIEVSVTSPWFSTIAPVAALGSMSRVLAGCFNTPKTVGVGSVNAIPVVILHVPGGSGTQALAIALKGDPLILSMTQFSGSHTLSTTTLSHFNTAITISPPAESSPIAQLVT